MGRKKGKKVVPVETFDSDDERAYQNEEVPDKGDDDFYHDEVDQFHLQRDKLLLQRGAEVRQRQESEDEEEVLGFDDDSDEDDEEIAKYEEQLRKLRSQGVKEDIQSDIESNNEEEVDEEKGWGKKKQVYYGDDMDDYDDIESGASETEAAVLEEQEALTMQKRWAAQLDDDDFLLDDDIVAATAAAANKKTKDVAQVEEIVAKDLSKLNKKEKLALLKKQAPELQELVGDFKAKWTELEQIWLPIYQLIKAGKLHDCKAVQFINCKVHLVMNYCTNVSYYMMLKARCLPVENHPVIKRLLQYRNLLNQLERPDIMEEVQLILRKIKNGEDIVNAPPAFVPKVIDSKRKEMRAAEKTKQKKKLSQLLEDDHELQGTSLPEGGRTWGRKRAAPEETADEKEALEYYKMMTGSKKNKLDEEDQLYRDDEEQGEEAHAVEEEEYEDGKRAITYQIEKNKGLTPKRKKDQRNPRVKHRMKYKKAIVRRKGQVREVRKEMTPYGGEISGIRAGVKKSIKLK